MKKIYRIALLLIIFFFSTTYVSKEYKLYDKKNAIFKIKKIDI